MESGQKESLETRHCSVRNCFSSTSKPFWSWNRIGHGVQIVKTFWFRYPFWTFLISLSNLKFRIKSPQTRMKSGKMKKHPLVSKPRGFRLQRMFQFAFSSLWEENRGFAPSSRREQQSTGLLHLAGFESTLQNAYTSQKHHPNGWCFWLEKVECFDRNGSRGCTACSGGCISFLGGCKQQRGCN